MESLSVSDDELGVILSTPFVMNGPSPLTQVQLRVAGFGQDGFWVCMCEVGGGLSVLRLGWGSGTLFWEWTGDEFRELKGVGGTVLLARDREKIAELRVTCSASVCVWNRVEIRLLIMRIRGFRRFWFRSGLVSIILGFCYGVWGMSIWDMVIWVLCHIACGDYGINFQNRLGLFNDFYYYNRP